MNEIVKFSISIIIYTDISDVTKVVLFLAIVIENSNELRRKRNSFSNLGNIPQVIYTNISTSFLPYERLRMHFRKPFPAFH